MVDLACFLWLMTPGFPTLQLRAVLPGLVERYC